MRRRRFTLIPALALAALGLFVTLPMLASTHLYAASAERFTSVTVHSGDSLWSLAAARTPADGNVQDVVDRVIAVNHLAGAVILPGQRLRIPE
ncbi:MAG: LysM peptidoglycan-binding domain-containing protein [Candidatus Baltobacteraceae bacterium]